MTVSSLLGDSVFERSSRSGALEDDQVLSTEKLGEARTYVQCTVLTDRLDYVSPLTTNWAYALAIERLTGPVVPERAEFLCMITGELSRVRQCWS